MYLFFDTETTGIPKNYNAPITDFDNWPRLVQIGWIFYDQDRTELEHGELIIFPQVEISEEVSKVHGITQEKALREGWPIETVLRVFGGVARFSQVLVGHNLPFDYSVVGAEYFRNGLENVLEGKTQIDTMRSSADFCKIPGKYGKYKWPKLHELYYSLFHEEMGAAHTALMDISNTAKCYFELVNLGVIQEVK